VAESKPSHVFTSLPKFLRKSEARPSRSVESDRMMQQWVGDYHDARQQNLGYWAVAAFCASLPIVAKPASRLILDENTANSIDALVDHFAINTAPGALVSAALYSGVILSPLKNLLRDYAIFRGYISGNDDSAQ